MTEPLTHKHIVVYDITLLGGDEPPVAFVSKCTPDPLFFNKPLAGMVFTFTHFEEIVNEVVTGMVKIAPGSKFIPLEDINDGYAGLVLQKVDVFTFIESKETVNVEVLKEALQTQQE